METLPQPTGPFSKGEIKRISIMAGVPVDAVMRIVRATLDAHEEKTQPAETKVAHNAAIDEAARVWLRTHDGVDNAEVAAFLYGLKQ